jgi:hypothetical protein
MKLVVVGIVVIAVAGIDGE